MNFLYKIPAIIYRTHDERGAHSPYFDMLLTIVFIVFIHAVHIGLIFNLPSHYIMPWDSTSTRGMQWLWGSLYFGGFITLFAIIFRKSKLNKVQVSQKQIDRTRIILPWYLAFCILLLFILLVKSGVEQGKINF